MAVRLKVRTALPSASRLSRDWAGAAAARTIVVTVSSTIGRFMCFSIATCYGMNWKPGAGAWVAAPALVGPGLPVVRMLLMVAVFEREYGISAWHGSRADGAQRFRGRPGIE